jgi:hypothetical protein
MTPLLDLYKKVGFTRPDLHADLWNRITAEWLNSPDQSIKMWGPWFRYYPFSEKLDNRFVDTVKMLREESKSRGLELVLSVADEPGSHPWTTEATQHYNDLIKAKVPDVLRELTTGGGPGRLNTPEGGLQPSNPFEDRPEQPARDAHHRRRQSGRWDLDPRHSRWQRESGRLQVFVRLAFTTCTSPPVPESVT